MRKFYICLFFLIIFSTSLQAQENSCVGCHKKIMPKLVSDWEASKHFENEIDCVYCHTDKHQKNEDSHLAELPTEQICAQCHEGKYEEFMEGKHSKCWQTLNALPVTHMEPDELIEGAKGCGGCHSMGVKTEQEIAKLQKKSYRYNVNPCDSCHTRHSFSKKEASDPKACQQCHMGFDHPQYEMWDSSKHGTKYFVQEKSKMPKSAAAPTCQFCHLPNGTHKNKTASGFFGISLPLSKDKEHKEDQIVILKALGVLSPTDNKKTKRFESFKDFDMIRVTTKDFEEQREKMKRRCANCHSKKFYQKEFEMADSMIKKADKIMADAIRIVAKLYEDKILVKPKEYKYNYPDLLYFWQKDNSHIENLLFELYAKHRMRTFKALFHANPDYAYWYGWAAMKNSFSKIKKEDKNLRALFSKNKKTKSYN